MQCQYPLRRSSLENTLASVSSVNTSSRIGNGCRSLLRAWLSACGSMQICSSSSFLVATTMRLTHCVGSSTLAIIFFSVSSMSSFCSFGLMLTGTLEAVSTSDVQPTVRLSGVLGQGSILVRLPKHLGTCSSVVHTVTSSCSGQLRQDRS
ncbi:unnamed protein product [Ixodes hexagonus]